MIVLGGEKLWHPLPPRIQQDNYSCGPAVASAILARHGRHVSIEDLVPLCRCTPTGGTRPAGLLAAFEGHGLHCDFVQHATLDGCFQQLKLGRSVALNVDAWGSEHWVALVGRTRGKVLLCDPASETGYSYIRVNDFAARWPERIAVLAWNGAAVEPSIMFVEAVR